LERRHKIPLKLKLIRFKNSGFFSFTDKIINFIKPPKKFSGVPEKILIFRNDRIGDAICTLPVLRDLKNNYPDLKIHVVCSVRNRFVFENFPYIDKLIVFSPDYWEQENLKGIFKLPVIGKMLQFFFHVLMASVFDDEFKKFIADLEYENYDAVVDLIGRRRIAVIGRMVSKFTAGGRLFLLSWMYSYYMKTNWVSLHDKDFMSRKIQFLLEDSLNFKFEKRNEELPYYRMEGIDEKESNEKTIDVFIHLGTGKIRKFEPRKEIDVIEALSNYKMIVTDGYESENFKMQREYFKNFTNIEFKIYSSLTDIIPDVKKSRLMLSYDGGQTHLLSQYVPSVVIFGPGSVELWKPYEFRDYKIIKEWDNNLRVIQSGGNFQHQVIHKKIWCSPCFDIGCKQRPCLGAITPGIILETIKNKLVLND
jgi:ADP-heptose:LPS heptosyltransferase